MKKPTPNPKLFCFADCQQKTSGLIDKKFKPDFEKLSLKKSLKPKSVNLTPGVMTKSHSNSRLEKTDTESNKDEVKGETQDLLVMKKKLS